MRAQASNVHAVQLNVFKCHLHFCCGVTCITTRAKNLDSRLSNSNNDGEEKNWKLEMADRFFFNDYLTQKRNEWLNGWSKENTVTINYTPHLYTVYGIRKFQFFKQIPSAAFGWTWTWTQTHLWCAYALTKEASFNDSFIFLWLKKKTKTEREKHTHIHQRRNMLYFGLPFITIIIVCVLFCIFLFALVEKWNANFNIFNYMLWSIQ